MFMQAKAAHFATVASKAGDKKSMIPYLLIAGLN